MEGTIRSPSLDIRALYSDYLYYTHQGRGGREGIKGKSNPSHLRMAESSCPTGEGYQGSRPSSACNEDLSLLLGLPSTLQDRLLVCDPGNSQEEEKQVAAASATSPVIT